MKYVFIKKFETGETSIGLIDDPLEVFKSGEYKPNNGDKIYQLGSEVTVEVSVKVKSSPVYRGGIAIPAIDPAGTLMNDDLGVGDYRG